MGCAIENTATIIALIITIIITVKTMSIHKIYLSTNRLVHYQAFSEHITQVNDEKRNPQVNANVLGSNPQNVTPVF